MARRVLRALACAATVATTWGIKVGDLLPDVSFDLGFPPEKVPVKNICKGKKVVVIPGYLAKEEELKKAGVDEVAIYAVNDGAVMDAWKKDQGVPEGSIIKLYGDPDSEVTKALDLVLDHPGPMSVLGYKRCKRFSLIVKDCKVKTVDVADAADDPAGDDKPEVTLAENMLAHLKAKKDEL